jgi:ankyrin repeat protein
MKKIVTFLMIFAYIFNIGAIGYCEKINEKIALTNNIDDQTVFKNVVDIVSKNSIAETQILRKTNPVNYETLIARHYETVFEKQWNALSPKQKIFFLYIGINPSLFEKTKILDPETIDYLSEIIENHGEEKIIQNNFENILSLIKDLNSDISIQFLKILENLFIQIGLLSLGKHQKDASLYENIEPLVQMMLYHFFSFLLDMPLLKKNLFLQQTILNIYLPTNPQNSKDENLLLAVLYKFSKIANLLLENGANINFTDDEDGTTPLMQSISMEDIETLQILLAHKPNIDQKDNTLGYNALMLATCKNPIFLNILIKAEADIEIRNNLEQTALMLAVISKNIDAVKTLLIHGAIIEKSDMNECSVMDYANEEENLKLMLKNEQIHRNIFSAHWDKFEEMPVETLQKLLFINYKDKNGDTALHKAIKLGDEKLINAILDNPNLDVNTRKNALGLCVSLRISLEKRFAIIKLLLEKNLDPNVTDTGKEFEDINSDSILNTILMIGKNRQDGFEMIKLLLAHGAKITGSLQTISSERWMNNQNKITSLDLLKNWEDSPQKSELIKLFLLQLLKEGQLIKYMSETVSEILTFLIHHDALTEITESLMQKLHLLINKNDGIIAIGMDIKKLNQLQTLGI